MFNTRRMQSIVGRTEEARPATFARCVETHVHWCLAWLVDERKRQGRLHLRVARERMCTGVVG